jgi:hypothetical protein
MKVKIWKFVTNVDDSTEITLYGTEAEVEDAYVSWMNRWIDRENGHRQERYRLPPVLDYADAERMWDWFNESEDVGDTAFIECDEVEIPDPKVDMSPDPHREAAKLKYHSDGEIEIDDGAIVSVSEDGGAYVQAWVWVYDEDF